MYSTLPLIYDFLNSVKLLTHWNMGSGITQVRSWARLTQVAPPPPFTVRALFFVSTDSAEFGSQEHGRGLARFNAVF